MKTYIITEQDIENLKYGVSDIDRFTVDRWQEALKVHSNLDMKALDKKFDEILEGVTREELVKWLKSRRENG